MQNRASDSDVVLILQVRPNALPVRQWCFVLVLQDLVTLILKASFYSIKLYFVSQGKMFSCMFSLWRFSRSLLLVGRLCVSTCVSYCIETSQLMCQRCVWVWVKHQLCTCSFNTDGELILLFISSVMKWAWFFRSAYEWTWCSMFMLYISSCYVLNVF